MLQQESDIDSVSSLIARVNVAYINRNSYIADSGATHHMVNNAACLTSVKPIATRFSVVGNGQRVPTLSTGTLTDSDTPEYFFKDVSLPLVSAGTWLSGSDFSRLQVDGWQ